MIKNKFQQIYRKIISQTPILDKLDNQVDQVIITPQTIKCTDQTYRRSLEYRFLKLQNFLSNLKYPNVANIKQKKIDKIHDNQSSLIYYQTEPFSIYNMQKDELFDKFKIKAYNLKSSYIENIIDGTWIDSASIALQLSIIYLHDISLFKSNSYIQENFVVKQLIQYFHNEKGIKEQLNETIRLYDKQLEENFKEEYINDINKGGIVFIYSIVDLDTDKILYINHDIFENKKFLTEIIPHTIDQLKTNIIKYFKQKAENIRNTITNILAQKLIEIKNNY